MKQYPTVPDVDDADPALLESGHLWLLELLDGAHLRFQVRDSGLVHFGDRTRVYETPDAVPAPYQHAVRYVRENLDRDALRNAVSDVEDVVFFGTATIRHEIEYDWDRIPPFLGVDVWSARDGGFRPPDAVDGIYDELGLEAVNAFERERHARDFDPATYSIPDSHWYDGPPAGVLVRNKQGGRARLQHPAFAERTERTTVETSAAELADRFATTRRFEKLTTRLREQDTAVTVETLGERVFEDVARTEYDLLYRRTPGVDAAAVRAELATRTRQFLREANSVD